MLLFRKASELTVFVIKLLDKLDKKIQINLKTNKKSNIIFLCDLEQMNRVFFNLIKNSIYAITEFSRYKLKKHRIIAFPGCYPT